MRSRVSWRVLLLPVLTSACHRGGLTLWDGEQERCTYDKVAIAQADIPDDYDAAQVSALAGNWTGRFDWHDGVTEDVAVTADAPTTWYQTVNASSACRDLVAEYWGKVPVALTTTSGLADSAWTVDMPVPAVGTALIDPAGSAWIASTSFDDAQSAAVRNTHATQLKDAGLFQLVLYLAEGGLGGEGHVVDEHVAYFAEHDATGVTVSDELVLTVGDAP